MPNPVIAVENLCKRYTLAALQQRHDTLRDHLEASVRSVFRRNRRASHHPNVLWALKDVSFDVNRGEVVGIIGANGAGKSTILKILSRITEPTSGLAKIRGRVASLLEVGTGFQPELSGRDNVFLSGAILGMRRAEITRRFDEIVDFSGIEKFLDTPVKRYSSGMYVRLAFAVAAHLEPEILFVDEVLAVGDVGFQRKCLAKMGDVARGGRTILFVSHNLAAVKSLCHRTLMFCNGSLESDGPSDSVVAQYLARFESEVSRPDREEIHGDDGFREGVEGYLLRPKSGRTNIDVLCGEPITLEFDIESPTELSEVTAGIVIVSSGDEKIIGMSSKVQKVRSVSERSRCWNVQCHMGRLPLNAGNYSANVYVGDGMHDVARFTRAFTIKVRENDVFGWGNSVPDRDAWGPMYWAPTWHIASIHEQAPTMSEVVPG
jgi:lipopolysaccharide transport system ATP-binding protein